MRTLSFVAALAAGVFSATLTAEAGQSCAWDGDKWAGCKAHGAPKVAPEDYVGIDVTRKDVAPGKGCKLLDTARGSQRWSCPISVVHAHQRGPQ